MPVANDLSISAQLSITELKSESKLQVNPLFFIFCLSDFDLKKEVGSKMHLTGGEYHKIGDHSSNQGNIPLRYAVSKRSVVSPPPAARRPSDLESVTGGNSSFPLRYLTLCLLMLVNLLFIW